MKATSFALLLIAFLFSSSAINAQKKYKGTIFTKFSGTETGLITVNLNGVNNELIEIETTEQLKTKDSHEKSKQTTTTFTKVNVGIISHLIINDTTYYFRDIKYDYKEKYYMNVCVRLAEGTLNCGIFTADKSLGESNMFIKLPGKVFTELVSADFDYYKTTMGWHISAFGKCSTMYNKMAGKQTGYSWDDNNSQEQRLSMWKKWVQEFNACKIMKE